ncbi:uncharacterized protein LOC122036906 [Zingiber officinale]|uniref:Uncharacterized protein n=1 Tax=Zingiber officinale TaxID=94328 RepID=A0A8J5C125_ZINOF|nr:uncharacterized protein LOC122036906 [Zingiber officinale]KAG6467137.1 hypothetical protein ZIOFF_075054 [Zingiber officinale]
MPPLVLPTVDLKDRVGSLQGYFHGEAAGSAVVVRKRGKLSLTRMAAGEEEASSSICSASSSFSALAHGEEEEEDEEAESERKDGGLMSLDSLEDAIPVKRGLSNFFSGKSKSFAILADIAGACSRDVAKPENPFNKRRRLLLMRKTRRTSYISFLRPPLPPLLSPARAVEEGDEEGEEDEQRHHRQEGGALGPFPHLGSGGGLVGKRPFRSPRCFSLSDLQHHA